MDKKIAIVTGGNSGLGYATAKKFCDNWIKSYVIGRTKERTEDACAAIELMFTMLPPPVSFIFLTINICVGDF